MNLFEVNALIERVKGDKELFDFYTKKKQELLLVINSEIKRKVNLL